MILMANYWLDHGMSSPGILWANLPYPYNTETYSGSTTATCGQVKAIFSLTKQAASALNWSCCTRSPGTKHISMPLSKSPILWPIELSRAMRPFAMAFSRECRQREGLRTNRPRSSRRHTVRCGVHLELDTDFDAFQRVGVSAPRQLEKYQETARIVPHVAQDLPADNQQVGPIFRRLSIYSDTEINADTMAPTCSTTLKRIRHGKAHARGILDWVTALSGTTISKNPGNADR